MKVSIIVPLRDSAGTIGRVLEALARLDPPAAEVIVVDDASRDGGAEIASRHPVRLLRLAEPRGAAAARNAGAAAAAGEVLFFVDSDVVLPDGAVGKVKAALDEPQALGAVVGVYSMRVAYPNWPSHYQNCFYAFHHARARPGEIDFMTCCGAVRAALFREVGGFDERIRGAAGEDKQLGWAIRARGFEIGLARDLEVEHLAVYSWKGFVAREFRLTVAVGKSFLRTRSAIPGKLAQRNFTGAYLGIPVVACWLVSVLWLVLRPGTAPAVSAAALTIVLAVLNAPFCAAVGRTRGPWWALGMALTGAVDLAVIGAALAWAAFDFLARGSRY